MKKALKVGFWELIARIILKNRIIILGIILAITVFLGLQWKNLAMTYTEANLLPEKHIANKQYQDFLNKFGEEGNLIVIGFKDNSFFTPKAYAAWNELMTGLKKAKEVGVEHFFVEQDMVANPQVALKRSSAFLTSKI